MKKLIAFLLATTMLIVLCACGEAKPDDISIEYDGEEVSSLEFTLGDDEADDIVLKAKLSPKGAKGEIEWASSDREIVKVRDNGDGTCRLVLKDAGSAKISASCGDLKTKVKVSVAGPEEIEEEPAAEPAPAAPAVTGDDIRGFVSGTHFEIPYLGIGMDVPSGMTFMSKEEITESYGQRASLLEDDSIIDALKNGESVSIMGAQNTAGDSVNITVCSLNGLEALIIGEDLASLLIPEVEKEMTDAGLEVKSIDTIKGCKFAGKEQSGISLTLYSQGITIYEKMVFAVKDSYYYIVAAGSLKQSSVDSMLDMFYGI